MQAQHHLGKAEARVRNGDADVAGEHEFKAGAEAVAVEDGDGPGIDPGEAVEHGMRLFRASPRMSAVEAPTNCWISAPAAKPDGLAERRTTAAGFSAMMRSTRADSSSTTERSTVLTALSGRSRTIHITRSSSVATRKFPVRLGVRRRGRVPGGGRQARRAFFSMGSVLVFWFVRLPRIETLIRPLRATSRRPGRRRYIRWRCRASCRGGSWRSRDAA